MPLNTAQQTVFDHFATLMWYPSAGHHVFVETTLAELGKIHPELEEMLSKYKEHVDSSSLSELEETYTRTFDIAPDCALEIGWHLYGESYTRGSFLVEMRGRMRALELEESAELPDHLGHICRVLAKMPEDEAAQFCRDHLVPALSKMREKLPEDRPHACLLEGIEHVVRKIFSIEENLTSGKEAFPYFREIETLPPGFQSPCGGMP